MVKCPKCNETIEHIDMVQEQETIFRLLLLKHELCRPVFDRKTKREYRCPNCKVVLTTDNREADLLIAKDLIDKYGRCPMCNADVKLNEQKDYYSLVCIKCGMSIIGITKGVRDDE